jgi:hypothetical protein
MAFRFGRKPVPTSNPIVRPATVLLDQANGIPAVLESVSQFAKGDWRTVESAHSESRDWDTRAGVIQSLAELDPSEEWIAACPQSALAHAVRGAQLRRLAWDVRGSGKASTVPKTAWGDFFATLAEAERSLRTATVLASDDPYPWAQLIWTGTGLQVSKDEILMRFAAMQERDAGHIYGWLAVISSVAQKWGGSHELMFDVARSGDRDLPAGSIGRVGVVRAHEERRLYLSQWENNPEGAKEYFRQPDVAGEVSAAASNSVLSDRHHPSGSTRLAQSWFAYALALVGDGLPSERLRAASLFLQLGNSGIPNQPWQTRYGSRGGEQYARIRTLCYRAAGIAVPD